MSKKKYTLVINPGATSTKAAIYEGENEVFTENLSHPIEEIQKFKEVADQFDYRKTAILDMVKRHGVSTDEIAVVMGITVKNVSVRLYRIKEELKNMSNQ